MKGDREGKEGGREREGGDVERGEKKRYKIEKERGREGERERGREGERERGREGERKGEREGERKRGREMKKRSVEYFHLF